MYAPIRAIITSQDIIDAYEAHGNDCMIIDIDNLRKTTYAQYGDIFIKKANGEIVHPRYWKLSGQGITTSSTIKEPSKRSYAQIRIGLCQVTTINDEQVETDNMKALKLICELYENKMNQLKDSKIITDNDKAPRKQADGTQRPVYFMSTKIVSPMDTVIIDRETGEAKDREYPYYWISVPQKRFYKADEIKKESVHFNDQFYFDADKKAPDTTKPIMTFEYAPTFYNIDDFIHHPRTGKKVYKKFGQVDENEPNAEPVFDNTNIHKYITKGTAMVGNLKFELVVAGRQAKLDISLYGSIYARQGTYSHSEEQDDECLTEFSNRYAAINLTKKQQVNEDLDEPDLDDF